jgi:hypothetical protein
MSKLFDLNTPRFSEQYTEQLLEHFGPQITLELTQNWHSAPLTEQPGERIPFVRLNEGATEKPVFIVGGFGEGIINKAPFAGQLALDGADVVLIGQNRKSMLKDAAHKRVPTHAQARNIEAVIRYAGMGRKPKDIITHSYGSDIYDAMVERSEERGDDWYQDSTAILLAPSGFVYERLDSIVYRWGRMLRSEMDKSRQDFPDHKGETAVASTKTLAANLPRMFGEIGDLLHKRVDARRMLRNVGQLVIMNYFEDEMYPPGKVEFFIEEAMRCGAIWTMPYSTDRMGDGLRGFAGATHDDEQFNPRRVAGAVGQFILPGANRPELRGRD